MAAHELLIKINGTAKQFTDELKKVKKETDQLEKGLGTVAKVSAVAFAALTATIGGAVAKFAGFEKGFSNVVTLLDKGSFATKDFSSGVEGMKRGVIALAAESGDTFDSLNSALFDLVSAGFDAEDAIDTLRSATELATAGATDTATAVKAITAATTAFGKGVGSAQVIAEKFFTAQKFGITTVGKLADEFNKVGGFADTLGISFDETLASATALTTNGATPTAEAFTQLSGVMSGVILAQGRLAGESAAVQNALSLTNIESVGLVAALKQTVDAVDGDTVALQRLIGRKEALAAVLSLTGKQASVFTTIMKEMSDETKRAETFSAALATKQKTVTFAMNQLKSSANALAVVIGEQFAPLIIDVAKSMSAAAVNISNMDKGTIKLIATFLKFGAILTGVVAGLATTGIAIIKIKGLITALTLVFGAARVAAVAFWTASTLGVAALIALIPSAIEGITELLFLLTRGGDPKSLDDINKKLLILNETRRQAVEDAKRLGETEAQYKPLTDKIDAEIASLKARRREIEKSKGLTLTDPIISGGGGAGAPKAGKDSSVDDAKKRAQELIKIEKDSVKRIGDIRKLGNDILRAEENGASQAFIDNKKALIATLGQISALEKEQATIKAQEKNEALREINLENNEVELELLEEKREALIEREAEQFEEDQERRAEFDEMKTEQEKGFSSQRIASIEGVQLKNA